MEEGDVPAIDGEATAVDEADGKEEKRREIDLESSDEEGHFGERLQTGAMKTTSEESLAKPEIQGLWERSERKATLSGGRGGEGEGDEGKVGEGGVGKVESKAEREMREGVMEKLRKSVVVKQVAAGREFKVSGEHCVVCCTINSKHVHTNSHRSILGDCSFLCVLETGNCFKHKARETRFVVSHQPLSLFACGRSLFIIDY